MLLIKKISDLKKLFENRRVLSLILTSSSWLMFDRVARALISITVGAWFIRYLGPTQFGDWAYSIAIISIMAPICALGLDQIIMRELSRNPDDNSVISSAFYIKLLLSVICCCIIVVYSIVANISKEISSLLIINSLSLLLYPFGVIDTYFQSRMMFIRPTIIREISLIVVTIIKVIMIYVGINYVYFAILSIVELVLVSLGLIIIYYSENNNFKWELNLNKVKKLIIKGFPIFLTGMFSVLYMKIDQIMLKNMVSSQDLGFYSVAVSNVELFFLLIGILITTCSPIIFKITDKKDKSYMIKYDLLFRFAIFLALLIIILIIIFGKIIIINLYGESFEESYKILFFYAWILIFYYNSAIINLFLISEHLEKYCILIYALQVVVNFTLNLILIPIYGSIGAILSALIAYIFGTILIPLALKPTRPIIFSLFRAITFTKKAY